MVRFKATKEATLAKSTAKILAIDISRINPSIPEIKVIKQAISDNL